MDNFLPYVILRFSYTARPGIALYSTWGLGAVKSFFSLTWTRYVLSLLSVPFYLSFSCFLLVSLTTLVLFITCHFLFFCIFLLLSLHLSFYSHIIQRPSIKLSTIYFSYFILFFCTPTIATKKIDPWLFFLLSISLVFGHIRILAFFINNSVSSNVSNYLFQSWKKKRKNYIGNMHTNNYLYTYYMYM